MPAHAGAVRPNVNPAHRAAISARPTSLAFGVVMVFLPAEVAPECTASRIEYQSHSRGRARHVDAGAVGAIVVPRLAAKLVTSTAFVKWLTTPITSSTGISAHLGRLAGIAAAEPELREAIDQYTAALRSVPAR